MGKYKKSISIKQNIIKNLQSMVMKIANTFLIWGDKLSQALPMEKKEYRDLTPEDNIKNGLEYIEALFWGIKNKNVKNIALTGPYGSGKSSIIQSYLKKYPDTKALKVSLATFDLNKEKGEDFENVIEIGILKQLFYKVDSAKIPQSRYRKIKIKHLKTYLSIICGVTAIILLEIAFFMPNSWDSFLNRIVDSGRHYGLNTSISYVIAGMFGVIGIFLISNILKLCDGRFKVKELNIADKATVVDAKDESSIFDKSMDELVYFFEATDYSVVFIEDLDRFDSTKIFVKLRELNTILNNYDLIRRRIVFVYAIKDDMFRNEERTKFFDFIIPVIPIINSTNSGEILREKLQVKKQDNGLFKSSIYNISSNYITLISPFIEDMRVLTNICNEFIVYKNTLNGVNLKDEEMFSVMVFKSLYPDEFSKLEAEKGIVKEAFADKKLFINKKQSELEEEKNEYEKILYGIDNDILQSVRDVKSALLSYLIGNNGPFYYCYIGGEIADYNNIMNDNFDINKLIRYENVDVYNSNRNCKNVNIRNDVEVKKYLQRIEYLKNNSDSRKNEMKQKIEQCKKSSVELSTYSLKKIMEMYGNNVLSEEVQKNKLLVFFLRKGFINENYADYINYFYPNSITKEEMNFVRGIRMQEAVGDYSYAIRNVEQVYEQIEEYEFRQIEILNFNLVDYLITKKRDSKKCEELFLGLSERGSKDIEFILAYIERGKNIDIFINILCKRYKTFWDKIVNDEFMAEDRKFEYLTLILEHADANDIFIQNENSFIRVKYGDDWEEDTLNGINSFIEEKKESLRKLSNVSSEKMREVIEKLSVIFSNVDINGVDADILKFIFENDYYEINMHMIHNLFMVYYPEKVNQLKIANYTTIRQVKFQPLIDRLLDINDFITYVEKIVVEQESNIEENISAVEDILERLYDVDLELCKKVLEHENIIWNRMIECCKCPDVKNNERKLIWDYIIKKEQVEVLWDNFIDYYNKYQLTPEIKEWFDKSILELISQERTAELSDSIIKEIIIEKDISNFSVDELTSTYEVEQFDISLEKLDEDRISILIKNKYIPYSNEYLSEMYQVASSNVADYIITNKTEFMENVLNVQLEIETVIELLKRNCFDKEEINKILSLIPIADMDRDLAIEIQKLENPVPKEYSEKAWDLLEEDKRYQLLLNQFDNYNLREISLKLQQLAPVYQKLSDISKRHKEYLPNDEYGYNYRLLKKLKSVGYVSSVKINEYEYEEGDISIHKNEKKNQFEVWVKKQ